MSLEQRTQALLDVVENDRRDQCGVILAQARQQAQAALAQARLDARQRVREAFAEERERAHARVAAARALIGKPEFIIADEPTSSLDTDARESFIKLLFNECVETDISLIFVSHDASLQRLFDQQIDLPALNQATRTGV